jgi:hypothetical protein
MRAPRRHTIFWASITCYTASFTVIYNQEKISLTQIMINRQFCQSRLYYNKTFSIISCPPSGKCTEYFSITLLLYYYFIISSDQCIPRQGCVSHVFCTIWSPLVKPVSLATDANVQENIKIMAPVLQSWRLWMGSMFWGVS